MFNYINAVKKVCAIGLGLVATLDAPNSWEMWTVVRMLQHGAAGFPQKPSARLAHFIDCKLGGVPR